MQRDGERKRRGKGGDEGGEGEGDEGGKGEGGEGGRGGEEEGKGGGKKCIEKDDRRVRE